jgi:hypothetical protein
MHIHILCKERVEAFFPLLIASGITGIRDMGSREELDQIGKWRKQVEEETRLAPRIIAAGPILDGPKPMFPALSVALSDESEARRMVRLLKERGADFLKVYSLLPRDVYFAIADEANRQDIAFSGHVPESVSAAEASDAGQKSIEHLSGVRLACSSNEERLREQLTEARAKADPSLLYRSLIQAQTVGAQTYNNEKAEALFARFKKNGTWQVPTLTIGWALASIKEHEFKAVSSAGMLIERPESDCLRKTITAESIAITKAEGQRAFELVAAMRRAGVEFMAGTDAPNPWVFPGASLHDELSLLVSSGFTPMEALQTATRNPAKYLGMLDSLGTVEEGKVADLVLLEADPLEDIGNTRRISAVVVRGRVITKPELKLLESRAQAQLNNVSGPLTTARSPR